MRTKPAARELSPECEVGMCSLCPGDGIEAYAPGKRPPTEPPIFVRRCDHGCSHGGTRRIPRAPWRPS